jgi:hypothetical protein
MVVSSIVLINGAAEMRVKGELPYAHGDFRFYEFIKDCLLFNTKSCLVPPAMRKL